MFDKDECYSRRRWRQVQDMFWKRWVKEYLPILQARHKWNYPQRNIAEGDAIDSSHRGSWTLGRVISVMKDKKGLVRIAQVKTKTNVLQRPIHVDKLVLL